MITLDAVYLLLGGYLGWMALRAASDDGNPKRWGNAAFWGSLALLLVLGDRLPSAVVGALVVGLALLAGFNQLGRGSALEPAPAWQAEQAQRLGHRLFLPALVIPAVTLLVAVPFKELSLAGQHVFAAEHTTLVGLGLACLLAFAVACGLTRATPRAGLESSRRLLDAIGWAALLPLLLATLGSVFAATGVGEIVASLVSQWLPTGNRFMLVLAYALGMALFTMIMGNAFAAFPVLTAGIGLPLLVQLHGADAASLAAIGMLSGYCGTLLTPMAANFNLVPAALLELKDPHGVIRAQVGTALPLLACNVLLMYWIVFR